MVKTRQISADVVHMLVARSILDALKPGDDIMHLWHEIGRARMELRLGTGSRALDSEGGYFDEGGFFHKVSK